MLIFIAYFLLFLLALWILEKIPGISYLAKPLLDGIMKLLVVIGAHSTLWILWVVRTFGKAHIIFVKHLFAKRSVLNPSEEARKSRKSI